MYKLKFRLKSYTSQLLKRYSTGTQTKKAKSDFKDTVLLPKTKFPSYPKNILERDEFIQKEAKFLEYYDWQRKHVTGKEFVLHDGPPYANGAPHMGHAINKIFKDIILRSQLIQGSKVHFIPGWDCHGLPIELIALKESRSKLAPVEIRKISRELALSKIHIQRESFKKWGVIGNWDKHYYTCSPEYVVNELQLFWKLYEKGLIYYGLKPVYWSPSSGTALAEAELQYNENHVSQAVTVRFETDVKFNSEPVYLLIWTTTPWTLPSNKAVYFSTELEYSLVRIESLPGTYVIASNLIQDNRKKFNMDITVLRTVSYDELRSMKYKHPWRRDDVMSLFESSEVKEVATGLLHSAPAHGQKDFLLGLRDGLSADCFVDEMGCYTKEVGADMVGLSVLGEGSTRVIEKLKSDIVFQENFVHSYPYDWRTNQPVITRSSKQWFIDTDKLKSKAVECLSDVSVPIEYFKKSLETRPYWCLSRQRVWGVPIPVFTHKATGKPLLSKDLVDHVCELVKTSGTDSWWSASLKDLFPQRFCDEFSVKLEDVERGNDIMDIWFDSGVSWSFVLDGKKADVCVEGVDQYRGWFQSLLLTSVAIRGEAPYKKLLVHGLAVDEEGKKMSKSVGNVFDPNSVVEGDKALGVDVLRWWVAAHGHQAKAPVSVRLLEEDWKEINRLRQIMRFLLGALGDYSWDDLRGVSPSIHLDRYCLNASYDTYHTIVKNYNAYDFQGVACQLVHYVSNVVSALYIASIKDRLYCDEVNAERRRSCLYTLSGILDTLCHCAAPILPHLAEEVYHYHPFYSGQRLFYSEDMWSPPTDWKDTSANVSVNLAADIRKEILAFSPKSQELSCSIYLLDEDYDRLKGLNGGRERSMDSELTELLNVADVELKKGERKVTLEKTKSRQCPRCRRYTASRAELCARCEDVVAKIVSRCAL